MAGILIAVLVVGLCIYGIAFKIYTKSDHWECTGKLRANAKIVDFQQKSLNNYIKTTVVFDDGFLYTSYDANRKGSYRRSVISTNSQINMHIAEKAVDKHNELILKKK